MKVGLLTGGGDCPGLNAVIRAVVQGVANEGGTCVGFLEGWRGLVKGMSRDLDVAETDGIIARGGTILGSSRTNPFKNASTDVPALRENFKALGLDALVAIGGDDTLGVANRLYNEFQMPMVGVPKTIDNDLMVTDFTFGFDTAINIVTEAVDRLRTNRREPPADHRRRDDGPPRRLDRLLLRHRHCGRLHPRARGPDRHRPRRRGPQAASSQWQEL